MGNSASQLPYSIDKQVGAPQDHNGWALHNGKSTDGNEVEVSVFVAKKPQLAKQATSPRFPSKTQLVPALYHYNQCRKLRHPHILRVLASLDTDNPTAAASVGGPSSTAESSSAATAGDLIIVTEPCIPLDQWLSDQHPTPEQLAWGLECAVEGLHFLHNSAKVAHGNVSPSSFYVTRAGDVKLWNFSLLTPVGPDAGPNPHFQEWEAAITPESYRSPERVQQNYAILAQSGGIHAMDSFSLGVLMEHWFQPTGGVPAVLQKALQRLQTPNVKMRPRLQPLLKCPLFDTPYQKLQKELEEITIQPIEQKIGLWQNLALTLQAGLIPPDLSLYKVLPLIQSSMQTTCSNDMLLNQDLYRREVLAMIAPMFYIVEQYLEPAKVSKAIGPLVAQLFMVKDRGVRGALLKKVTFMSQHLDKSTLNSSVFEPLCSGFNDSSPALRELTLKATLGLVPYLNAPNLEKLSRYLVRLQSDTESAIRTNAVIFIAKIAPNLSEIARDKMLLPAYARGMKDAFSPCRMSALQSLKTSQDLFTKADLAAKVLPAMTPLLLDPMSDVRAEAFQVLDGFVKVLQQESDRLAHLAQRQAAAQPAITSISQAPSSSSSKLVPAPSSAGGSVGATTTNTTPTKVTPSPSSGRYLSGLSSWMSSSAKPDTPTSNPATMATAAIIPGTTKPVAPSQSVVPPAPTMATTTTKLATTSLTAPAADDGWGEEDDDGGWGDDGDDDGLDDDDDDGMEDPFANIGTKTSSLTTAATTTTTAAPSRIATLNATTTGTARALSFGGMDDDPFAAIGMKPATSLGAAALPKGKLILPKKTTGPALKIGKTVAAPAPATKLKLDSSEMGDGWDDF